METIKDKVNEWLIEDGEDCERGKMEDLLQYGCESGVVGDLIYYHDTCAFYEEHKASISDMLREMMEDCGIDSPAGLFGDKWESTDPLATDTMNQNLLAWFAFEETARQVAADKGWNI